MTSPTTLAIVPARSGSQELPDKNIMPLCDRPLFAHTINMARESGVFNDVFVSTESPEYAALARDAGGWVPFLRPERLAMDDAIAAETYAHTLQRLREEYGLKYDLVFALQPTSPLRREFHIQEAHARLDREEDWKAIVSVCELAHPAEWIGTLPEDLNMERFLKSGVDRQNRQEYDTYYRLNGALYGAAVDYFLENASFYGEGTYAYVMDRAYSIDIDTRLDFEIAEFLLKRIKTGNL